MNLGEKKEFAQIIDHHIRFHILLKVTEDFAQLKRVLDREILYPFSSFYWLRKVKVRSLVL